MAIHCERARTGAAHARNMSAPPRMRVTIRPLVSSVTQGQAGPAAATPPGFRLHGRVHLGELFAHHFQGRAGKASPHTQLGFLVLLARRALEPGLEPTSTDLRRLARRTTESLGDEFLECAERIDPRALGLPGFALLHRLDTGPLPELDPARAIAVVSRQDGHLFLATRSPCIPRVVDDRQRAFGLYVPDGGLRRGHP